MLKKITAFALIGAMLYSHLPVPTGNQGLEFETEFGHTGYITDQYAEIDGERVTKTPYADSGFRIETESLVIEKCPDGHVVTYEKVCDSLGNILEDEYREFLNLNEFSESNTNAYYSETHIMEYDTYGNNTVDEYSNTDGVHTITYAEYVGGTCIDSEVVSVIA